jgi:diadenosine tetraphosphate (Ap4A) HIT family hydrolase
MKSQPNSSQPDCPFCNLAPEVTILMETETALAILDRFPVSNGHTLIIPKRHIANYFDLTSEEQTELWALVNQTKQKLDYQYHPDGYNIGININPEAGQTIFHVHIHLIPRYHNDTPNPRGGVRGVIPERRGY